MIIHKKDFGENWPFTVDQVEIKTDKLSMFIKYKNNEYAINGFAKKHGFLLLGQSGIWADHPEISGIKKSLTPLFAFLA